MGKKNDDSTVAGLGHGVGEDRVLNIDPVKNRQEWLEAAREVVNARVSDMTENTASGMDDIHGKHYNPDCLLKKYKTS